MADDKLKEALEAFKLAQDAESDNRKEAKDDLEFARLGKQWPAEIESKRAREGRPCLTLNKMPAFIRQVVNDGRQNKPSIKVHPADSQADPKTAEVINGLIRNIEVVSNADTAYDTGLDNAVTMGFGYWRVGMDYAHDDSFDMDLNIQRISNPFSVYGDPFDKGADSSGWNDAFITDMISKKQFERKYKGAEKIDWTMGDYADIPLDWAQDENIMVAEWWRREQVKKTIVKLSDNRIVTKDWLMESVDRYRNIDVLMASGIQIVGDRETNSFKVVQRIMSGVEILEENDWPGIYIPIVSVFGEEVNVEGKRHLRSLIRDAKDPQRNFNYWRTSSTELVALSPKMPFIGAVGSFNTDSDKWATANTDTHAYIEYDIVPGGMPPQRQGFAGPPAGALQEAANATDDMKAVMGMYDASLGARSNETSGRAIMARQREGDTSTFHFIDNQSRAIRHTGRILIDLIPHVYNKERIIRVMGQDKKPQNVPINQPITGPDGQPIMGEDGVAQIYDLTVGKYDLTVETGPNFTTQREEASAGMTELMRALPQAAAVIAPHLAKVQDWPDAEKIGEQLAALAPGAQNPQAQQLQQQMQQQDQQAKQAIGQLQQQLQQAQQDNQFRQMELQQAEKELQIKMMAEQTKQFDAETKRMQAAQQAQLAAAPQPQSNSDIPQQIECDRWKAELDASTKIAVAQISAKSGIDKLLIQAEQAANNEVAEELSDDGTEGLEMQQEIVKRRAGPLDKLAEMHAQQMAAQGQTTQMLQAVAEHLSRPKRIIRGEDGRVAGVE